MELIIKCDQLIIKCDNDADRKLAYFKDSVDHALFCHGGSTLGKCSFHCETNQVSPYLYGWISAALCCNVQKLSVKSPLHIQALPSSLFTCRTLVLLEIEGPFLINLPFYVRFPCLKTLSLKFVIYGDDIAMQRLISSCPVLEDLKISRRQEWDGVLIMSVNVPTLKRLSIYQRYMEDIRGYEYRMVIDAPNLENLDLNDSVSKVIDVNFSDSLVEVDIDGKCGPKILRWISHVEELLLSGDTFVRLQDVALPVFHNLNHLELGVGEGWNFLSNLLSGTPNLEILVFGEGLLEPNDSRSGFSSFYWYPPESPPACLLHHLKEIQIHNFFGRPCECFVIRYLLDNSFVLDNMSIYWSNLTKAESVSYEKIMNYERASFSCEVELFAFSS